MENSGLTSRLVDVQANLPKNGCSKQLHQVFTVHSGTCGYKSSN